MTSPHQQTAGMPNAAAYAATARRNRQALVLIVALSLAAFAIMVFVLSLSQVTTSVTSPDGKLRAEIVDGNVHAIDRNFRLRIVDAAGKATVVFTSPDESPTGVGQERLLWSSDSQRLLLVGQKFWVREEAKLPSGECLYLLYDVPTGRVWCNSDQHGPSFGTSELAGFDFGEELTGN